MTKTQTAADRNLLFGIIALQSDFLTREQLVAGFDAWIHDKSRSLAEILQSQGALSVDDREILERLVGKFLQKHGGDAERSLAALSSVAQVQLDLKRLADPDLEASLAQAAQAPHDPRLAATVDLASATLGRFRILRPHAKGGLGQVSVALDQDLNREVALKEIQPQHADNQVSRERFLLEAEITGGLEHPGIVPVYALGQGPDGRPFYAMRFVKGDSLKQAIEVFHRPDNPNRQDPGTRQLALRQLLGRFIDVCNAIEYAHSRGVLHRDLKPGNIMVGKYGETLVVDWGLAKSVGRQEPLSAESPLRPSSALSSSGHTQPGSAIGTPAYMSPEQAAGKLDDVGPASDVYSLGATLYHLLCGRAPFEKEDVGQALQKVQRGDFPRPRSLVHEVAMPLEAICLKAMALKPTERYQTPRTLADDLEHWLADEPITAARDTLGDRLTRFGRKHRGYVRAGAAGLVLIALVSVVSAIQINNSRQTALELADKNKRLANAERDAKARAQDLATHNAQLAKDEHQARLAAERQLRIANAERLAAISNSRRTESPEASLLLAIESGRATRHGEEGLLPSSHKALLDTLTGIGGRALGGHRRSVAGVAISSDNRWIVTGGIDGTARLWDLTSENPNANSLVLANVHSKIYAVAFSPDGRWVVLSSAKSVYVHDLNARGPTAIPRVLTGHLAAVTCLAISADSRWLVTGSHDTTARIWDLAADNPSAMPSILAHKQIPNVVAVTPDNRWVVTASDRTVQIWDLAAANPASNPRILPEHKLQIHSVAISADSRWVITGDTGGIHLWDLMADDPGTNPRVLHVRGRAIALLSISPDGRWVVATSPDGTALVWDITAEGPAAIPRLLSGHRGAITATAISANSRWLVTGSADKTARIWDLTGNKPAVDPDARVLRGHEGGIDSVAISGDSRWVVTAGGRTVRLWNLGTSNHATNPHSLRCYPGTNSGALALSPDSRWVAAVRNSGGVVRVWDLEAAVPSASARDLIGDGYCYRVAISRDSRRLVAQTYDKIRVWGLLDEMIAENRRDLTGHQRQIMGVAIGPDSSAVVSVSADGTARVWDLGVEDSAKNPRVLSGHAAIVYSAAISSDGRWAVTGSGDKTARVWDLTRDDPAASARVLTGHESAVSKVAISPDDRLIVTGSSDKTVRIWQTNSPLSDSIVLTGHNSTIANLQISPDGRWLVTGGRDEPPRVWNLRADNPAGTSRRLIGHEDQITSVAISRDSRWVVTASHDRTVRIWDLTAENPASLPYVLGPHSSMVESVAISADSRWIVMGGHNSPELWRWQWDDLVKLAREVGRNFDREEWELYFPGEPYRKTFSNLPVPGDP